MNLGPQFLPGMEKMEPQQPRTVVEAPSATPGHWSGPLPGQTVMGVHDARHGELTSRTGYTKIEPFEVDKHGFVYEETHRPGWKRMTPSPDKAAGNPSARDLYRQYGGGRDKSEDIRAHWDAQPVTHIQSDTPVHTSQAYDTTEHKSVPGKGAGRDRIDAIRADLRAGKGITTPVWMVKQSGRLYSMDGHHRIVAAREEGLPDYPARVWDRDA